MKKISCKFFLILFFFAAIRPGGLPTNLYSQVTQEWVAIYDNPNHNADISHGIVVDATGNVYVAGLSQTLNNRSTFVRWY